MEVGRAAAAGNAGYGGQEGTARGSSGVVIKVAAVWRWVR